MLILISGYCFKTERLNLPTKEKSNEIKSLQWCNCWHLMVCSNKSISLALCFTSADRWHNFHSVGAAVRVIQSGSEKNRPRRDDDKALRQLRRWTRRSEKAKRHFNISADVDGHKNNGGLLAFVRNKTLPNGLEISFSFAFRKTSQFRLRWFI